MADVVFDFGNALCKWFNPRSNQFGYFRHAIAELNDGEWRDIAGRGTPPEGYVRVNGQGYAIGNAARRHIIRERPKGASRYHATYYGVGLAYALAEALDRSTRNVTLFASHAPRDIGYAAHLKAAARNRWEVECHGGTFTYTVNIVHTFDEPLGGYSHFVFTERGIEKRRNPLTDVITLVVDAGGYTVDVAAIDPGGEIDLQSLRSTLTGVLNMTERFERELRANNRTHFQNTGDLDIRKVETALMTGEYRFGKVVIDCRAEASAAMNTLTNDVLQVINQAGGVANYDHILLTGGGAALLHNALEATLPSASFLMAEPNTDHMKFANVFGGAKIAALLRNLKVIA